MVNDDNNFLRRRSMRSSELGDALLVGRGSKQPEEKSESQVTRAKSKNREYCQLFGLPASEELVEDHDARGAAPKSHKLVETHHNARDLVESHKPI